jgi:hypothetical protein
MIYLAHNDSYIHSNEDLSKAVGTNNDAALAFEPGKKYRIRVINMSALASESPLEPGPEREPANLSVLHQL